MSLWKALGLDGQRILATAPSLHLLSHGDRLQRSTPSLVFPATTLCAEVGPQIQLGSSGQVVLF